MKDPFDILESLENTENSTQDSLPEVAVHSVTEITQEADILQEIQAEAVSEPAEKLSALKQIQQKAIFIVKYFSTSIVIFAVLLVASNYEAYYNIIHSNIYAEEYAQKTQSIIESVAASEIAEKNIAGENGSGSITNVIEKNNHNINVYGKIKTNVVDLGIDIAPYENRIIIPRIGKNVPLLDISQTHVSGANELNNIFMKELGNGVIRYPGSAQPGEDGNSFIFGHSSNFPWIKGEFNDVFALLDDVIPGDEIIIYYEQEKFVYRIDEKNVIKPGDVSVLKAQEEDKKQISLMTCWPIGTTLNRLILTGELISE